jgi:hypothetical protein
MSSTLVSRFNLRVGVGIQPGFSSRNVSTMPLRADSHTGSGILGNAFRKWYIMSLALQRLFTSPSRRFTNSIALGDFYGKIRFYDLPSNAIGSS